MKLVAYTRLSQANDHEAESHDDQLARVHAWADAHGHEVVARCQDTTSGENGLDERDGLAAALDALDAGEADALAFARLDRLSRDVIVQETILREVWGEGHDAFSAAESEASLRDDPDDPTRRLIRVVLGAVNEYERAMIVLRMRRGRRRAIREGKIIGGGKPLAFGWTRGEGDAPVPVPGEIELVEEAVARRETGEPLRAIAAFLEAETGRGWSPTQASRIIERHARYATGDAKT